MLTYPSFFNGVAAPYQIEQSLRFDGSSNLLWTPSSTGDSVRKWTISVWVKQNYATGSTAKYMISAGPNTGTDTTIYPYTYDVGGISGQYYFMQGPPTRYVATLDSFRDESAWYHFVFQSDADNATTNDKLKIFVNGERVSTNSPGNPPVTQDTYWNSTNQHRIGGIAGFTNWTGYMAEFHSVDNQLVDPDQFGEYDNNGVWRPIEYTGTYGSNGFYLKFDPSATNGIGHDHSGNGNNWTPTGFTTSGTGTDVMSDTPTNNYCTLNPLAYTASGNPVLSEGNLVLVTPSVGGGNGYGTMAIPSSGKWYWEAHVDANSGGAIIGIAEYSSIEDYAWQLGNSAMYYFTGEKFIDGTATSYGSTYTTGDLIGVACDADAGTIQFYKEGTAQGSISHEVSGLFPCLTDGSSGGGCTYTINFGQRAFEQTPPTGYKALNTANLPAPSIKDGSKNFNTVLWTGIGGSGQSITGVGFQPDLVWIKDRDVGYDHVLQDVVRGTGEDRKLYSSRPDDETSAYKVYGNVSSFDADGFTVANGSSGDQHVNQNTYPYVAWNWKAGGSGSSIAAGSIDGTNPTIASTVSASPTAGFSIVTYAGSGTGGDSIAHGLGVPPKLIIAKSRGGGPYPTANWGVYHESLGASKWLILNSPAGAAGPFSNPGTLWYNTAPTSDVFYVGNLNETNGSNNYVAYCFAEIESYSKIGIYVGNNTGDGPFVYTGFKPAWLMVKKDAGSTDWKIYDAGRENYNVMSARLAANTLGVEVSGNAQEIDFVSNGFKFRGTNGDQNSLGTFYYVAFASNPFGGSGVSPATAR